MTETERVMSPVAGRPRRAEHDVIVIGNLTVDDVVHANGETTMASPGGNTIYAATGALIWGLSVGVVARVGADFPVAALDRLRDAGLDTGGLRPIEGPTVRNWVIYEHDGRRSWVYRTPPERRFEVAPSPGDIPTGWTDQVQQDRDPVVHVAAMPLGAAAGIVGHLRAQGRQAVVTLDTHEAWPASPGAVSRYATDLQRLPRLAEETLRLTDGPAYAAAERLAGARMITFLGAGPNEASAKFGAAKLFEGAQQIALATNVEEWAHEQYFITRRTLFRPAAPRPGNRCSGGLACGLTPGTSSQAKVRSRSSWSASTPSPTVGCRGCG